MHWCSAAGIKAVWELTLEIEQLCGRGCIRMLDIGGGLSVNYSTDEAPQVSMCRQDMMKPGRGVLQASQLPFVLVAP